MNHDSDNAPCSQNGRKTLPQKKGVLCTPFIQYQDSRIILLMVRCS